MAEKHKQHPLIEIADVRKSVVDRPPIIHEYVKPEHTTVVQPVIHREILKTEVRRVTQPIYEEISRPVQVHESELPAEIFETFEKGAIQPDPSLIARNEGYEPKVITTYATPIIKKVVLQPIIYETIIPEIIEEIQPIIHRTVHEAHIVKKQQILVESVDIAVELDTTILQTEIQQEHHQTIDQQTQTTSTTTKKKASHPPTTTTTTTTTSDTDTLDVSSMKTEIQQVESTITAATAETHTKSEELHSSTGSHAHELPVTSTGEHKTYAEVVKEAAAHEAEAHSAQM